MCRTQSQAWSRPEGTPVQRGEVRALSQGPKAMDCTVPKSRRGSG